MFSLTGDTGNLPLNSGYLNTCETSVSDQKLIWLQGDTIETNSARERPFTKKINPGDPGRKWDTTIIISHNDIHSLPQMMKQRTSSLLSPDSFSSLSHLATVTNSVLAGAVKLCTVQSNLNEVQQNEFDLKNKRCWQGRKYYLATFTVRVIIAPADLKFELWFKGQRYNRSHEPVQVEWDPVGANARPTSRRGQPDHWESYMNRPVPGRESGRFRSESALSYRS